MFEMPDIFNPLLPKFPSSNSGKAFMQDADARTPTKKPVLDILSNNTQGGL